MQTRYLRGILVTSFIAIFSVSIFFVAQRISTSQKIAPNAPESQPKAAAKTGKILTADGNTVDNETKSDQYTATHPKPTKKPIDDEDLGPQPTPLTTYDGGFQTPYSGGSTASPTPTRIPTIIIPTRLPTGIVSEETVKTNPTLALPTTIITPTPIPGSYGTQATPEQKKGDSYMSDANNPCKDGLGFVAGTGCFKVPGTDTYERKVLGLPETQAEAKKAFVKAQQEILNKSDNELLQLASIQLNKNCPISDYACQGKAIDAITQKLLQDNKVFISEDQNKITILRQNNQINTSTQFIEKVKKDAENYISSKTDTELAQEYCSNLAQGSANKSLCLKNFSRDELIANSSNAQELKKIRTDQSLATIYSDPKNSTTDLAKIYCKGNRGCEENFSSDRFLSQISDQAVKQDAINRRITALSTLIPQIVSGKPVVNIDLETKKEIIKLNEDTTHAFWVYVRENTERQRKQNITTEQLALEFNEKIKKDPSLLTKNIALYNATPKQYEMSFTTFKYDQEENPVITAQYNQILKTQTITGLANNGKAVIWDNADPLYKLQAMAQSCQSNGGVLSSNDCRSVTNTIKNINNINNPSAEDKKIIEAFTSTLLAEKFGDTDKSQLYLQEVFDNAAKSNLLSVTQSNLATIDNPALGDPTLQAEIKKANNAADVADIKNQMTYNTITYGDGMGMTPIIIPTTYKGNNIKLTDQEKADLANEYLRRQLVVETYTRGAGVGGALATASVATIACSGLGFGAVACGAVAGLAGTVSNIIPILGTATAEEIEAERQYWAQKTGNDFAGTFIQAMYSNQGASSDEAFLGGRSQSNLNNQYALLDRIHQTNAQTGASTQSFSDPTYQAQIALQPLILQQGELLQQENAKQQYVNIASSLVVGGISGGVGGSLAEKAITQTSNTLGTVFRSTGNEIAMWAGGAVINAAQTQYQFSSTTDFIDTELEIELEKCKREKGLDNCDEEIIAVADERITLNNSALQQAIITDAIIQAGQTATSFSTSLYGYFRPSTNSNTPSPQVNTNQAINPNDYTFISPELAQLLNLGDPRILNGHATNVDTITLNNLIKSQTIGENSRNITLEQFKNQNLNTSVADESILQGVTLYKDLPDAQFTAKLKEIGFGEADIEIALKIRESGTDILYTNSINERIEQNETLAGQLRNNPRDQSENLNIKVDQEIMSDYNNFRKQQAEKFVADAKKALETQNDQPTATAIDTKTEALKGFLAEASSPERLTPMNQTDIANLLTNLGYSPDDIQYVIDRSALPEVKTAIEKMLDFNNRSSQIRKEIANIDPNIQEDINVRINSQKIDLLSNLANSIPSTVPSNNSPIPANNTSATANRAIFKPGDDIHQTMPNNERNTIGKIPSKTIEIKGQQEQVYYRISYLENGKVTATEIHPLTDTNTLPTDKPFLLEFGIKKDPTQNIGDNNFTNINNSKNWKFKPEKTYEAKYNSFLEKTFIIDEPPTVVNGFTIRNSKGQSLNEFGQWRQPFFGFDSGHIFTIDEIRSLNTKIRSLSTDPLTIQSVEYVARPRSTNHKEEYNFTDLMKQEALKEAVNRYDAGDKEITTYLNKLGFTEEEITYAIDTRKQPELQNLIASLRDFDSQANTEMRNALQNTGKDSDFVTKITNLEERMITQRQELLTKEYLKTQATNLVPLADDIIPSNTIANTNNVQNNTPPQAPNQPAPTSLSNAINQLTNDTRVINRLVETTGGNYRVIYNDIVGDINTVESQMVRYAQETLGLYVEGKTLQQVAFEIKSRQDQARTIPKEATIKELDNEGNLRYTVEDIAGVTFIADKNSPESLSAKQQGSTNIAGKKASDLELEITRPSPVDELNKSSYLPENLKSEITSQYTAEQIADFNTKLNDPNYRPSNDPITSARRLLEQTPEDRILNLANKYGYDTNRSLSDILIDIRTTENQISKSKNITPLSFQQRTKSTLAIPRRLASKLLEIQRLFPQSKISVVDLYGGRVWSGNYLEGTKTWSNFTNSIENLPIDQATKKAIIDSAREHLTDHIKSSILANNPDLIHSPKGPYEDIFTDINPDEINSLGLMKKYFEKGGAFERDFQLAVNELNNVLENGGTLKRIKIDNNWKIPKYNTDNLNPSEVLLMGLSLEFNPDLPTKFHFLDNEVYSAVQGKDGQILNAALASELKTPGYVEVVADNFPVIRQTEINDPDGSKKYIERKKITIRGKALDPDPIPIAELPTSTKTILGNQDLTTEQINYLSQFNHETGTSVESLMASLSQTQREMVLKNNMTELEIRGVTDIEFNNTTQIGRDIAGLSVGTDAINEHISTPDGNKERFIVLDGWATFKSIMMESFDIEIKKIGNFITHERAGDGALNTSVNKLTSENIGQIIELSNLYETNIDKAIKGEFGPNVKRATEILIEKLGDTVHLKVGIGEGDTYATIHTNENGITVEFKSTSNVNQYMDNVKKYLALRKSNKLSTPEKIISVSENIYRDFSLEGYTKFPAEIEGKTAYFIIKDSTQQSQNTTRLNKPSPTRPNNGFKKLIINILDIIPISKKPNVNNIETKATNPKIVNEKPNNSRPQTKINRPIEAKIIEVTDLLKKNLLGSGETTVTPQVNPINQNISKAVDDYIKANFANMTKEDTQKIVTATKKRITQIIENYQKSRKPKAPKPPKQTKNTPKVSVFGVLKFFGFTGTSSILTYIFSSDPKTNKVTPTPTPIAIYASPTPTTTQPTTTISPVPAISLVPSPTTKLTNNPIKKQLSQSDMSVFATNAKTIGDAIIACQSKDIVSGPNVKNCFCEQITNNCQSGSVEERIANKLAEFANDGNLLQCLEFVTLIELAKNQGVGYITYSQGFSIDKASILLKQDYKNNYYFCPKAAVTKTGFVDGDVLIYGDGSDGHANICVDSSSNNCNIIEANKKDTVKDTGLVQYRDVNSTSENYAGVYRYSDNPNDQSLSGCTLKLAN